MTSPHHRVRGVVGLGDVQRALVLFTASCVVVASAWVLVQPAARRYEMIYDAYPTAFWLVIAAGLGSAGLTFLLSATRGDGYWRLAAASVCVIYLLYNFVPLFRGWALYGQGVGDVLTHVGYAKVILEMNHVPGWNFYPGFHVLLAEFVLAGVEARSVNMLFSAVFALVYVFGAFMLAKQLSGSRSVAVATLFVATLPLFDKFQHTFHPAIFSFMLLPSFLYLFERYRIVGDRSSLFSVAALSVVLVVSHPATSLYAIVMLVVAVAARIAYQRYADASMDRFAGTSVIAFVSLVWVAWYAQFEPIRRRLLVAVGFLEGSGPTVAESYGARELALAPTLRYVVVPFVERYGALFLVFALATVGVAVVVLRLRRRQASLFDVWLTSHYVVAGVIGVLAVTTFTAVLAFNPIRNVRYLILVGTLLTGFLLYWLLVGPRGNTRSSRRRAAATVVVLLLLLAFPLTVTNTYYPGTHLTYAEKEGTEWFYDSYAAGSLAVSHDVTEKMRMYDRGGRYTDPLFEDFGDDSPVPRHFGYPTHDTLGEVVDGRQTYLVTKQYDTEFYKALKPFLREESIVYTAENRRTLERDRTVDRVYSNGGYAVWFVNGTTSTNGSADANATLAESAVT